MIDYYNELPSGINVIDKMNEELDDLQKKYDELKQRYEPDYNLEWHIRNAYKTHVDMANLIYKLYKDKFRCTAIKKNEWYFYDDEEKKWKLLLGKVKLKAHKKHNFNNKLMKNKKINYIRINIYPDGGISRIRLLGRAE